MQIRFIPCLIFHNLSLRNLDRRVAGYGGRWWKYSTGSKTGLFACLGHIEVRPV